MKLIPVSAGSFHCDGGALFGVIPKVIWSREYVADEQNFTRLALRCLLIDNGSQRILVDTGIGNHYSEKHYKNNGYIPGNYLQESLLANGYRPEEITDVVLTHLHWDHCTGAVVSSSQGLGPLFPNARYWCSRLQLEHSKVSNPRERAAYHSEIIDFIERSGKLNLADKEGELFDGFNVRFVHGHTPGQMIPLIKYGGATLVYTSDLIPTAAHIPVLWTAAYDLDPVQVMKEKESILNEVVENNYILFFEHDYFTPCATVQKTEKGFHVKDKLDFRSVESTGNA